MLLIYAIKTITAYQQYSQTGYIVIVFIDYLDLSSLFFMDI